MVRSCKVAVIGAGMAGLFTARELLQESHDVTVFEKSNRVGGSWVYNPRTESDAVGLNPDREEMNGSLYALLRTNLPCPIMGFSDYSFTDRIFGDEREFPGHEEVLKFLEAFARDHKLTDVIKFGSEVVKVRRYDEESDRWMVKWKKGEQENVEDFEAVWLVMGIILSQMYQKFQVIVVVGMGPSGSDIAYDIAKVAKEVHVESRNPLLKLGNMLGVPENIFEHQVVSTGFNTTISRIIQ